MAKRGKSVRRLPVTRKTPKRRKHAPADVDLKKQIATLRLELAEALERQTATSEVLQVISDRPGELAPVFQSMVENATRVCGAKFGTMTLLEKGVVRRVASYNMPPPFADRTELLAFRPHAKSGLARAIRTKQAIQIADIRRSPAYFDGDPASVALVEVAEARTLIVVPMVGGVDLIGVITVYRQEVQPFTDKQVELLSNFAKQAVIAIENARLFNEVQAKTRDLSEALVYQTGSGNILKVIASSPTDVGPVLSAIVESACELCDAVDALVLLKVGDDLHQGAHYGPIPYVLEKSAITRNWVTGRSVIDKVPIHVLDMLSAEGNEFPDTRERAHRTGTHTYLCVPLLRERESIGAIVLRRTEVHPFSEKQIALLQTFADQAVIAIGNVRMFEQVQERTKEVSFTLDNLRTAQDRLIQTEQLASLGQLTAGIAHEIKNPLNFINNFSALSAELVDELQDALKPAALADKQRGEIDELTHMLKGNLEKVVQHGQRADSIVKNMLLHSREGSGERRLVDLNVIVEDSLNLAYHGARAEKREFNIKLERSFDPAAGQVDLFPQEITLVLLNLISNGVYAAMKRKAEMRDGYEPTLAASTGDLGDRVEIRIRDNGGGIPTEVKEKIFNPFFTTKPPGEGTGLGLSLSYDIIVKQHSGSIEVDTEPGEFTEFKVILPRKATLSKAGAS